MQPSLVVVCLFLVLACNRQTPPTPLGENQPVQKESGKGTEQQISIEEPSTKPMPQPFDSTAIVKLLSTIPTVKRFGMNQADECRLYQAGRHDNIYIYQKYAVRYAEHLNDLGSDIAVYSTHGKPDSVFLRELSSSLPFFFFEGDAEYFSGMRDSLLFTDVGTADVRGVLVYNVLKRKKVFDGTYAESFWLSSPDTLAYLEILQEDPDSLTYPEVSEIIARGNNPVILEQVKVSLVSFNKIHTGQRRLGVLD